MAGENEDSVALLGAVALGGRLRRLSERIDRDAGRLYQSLGIRFEQRWIGVVDLLATTGPMTVGELARSLGVSHASISQIRSALAGAGLIAWETDPADARRKRLCLSEDGVALERRLRPVWDALDKVAVELDAEAGNVLKAIEGLEKALGREPLLDRMARMIDATRGG